MLDAVLRLPKGKGKSDSGKGKGKKGKEDRGRRMPAAWADIPVAPLELRPEYAEHFPDLVTMLERVNSRAARPEVLRRPFPRLPPRQRGTRAREGNTLDVHVDIDVPEGQAGAAEDFENLVAAITAAAGLAALRGNDPDVGPDVLDDLPYHILDNMVFGTGQPVPREAPARPDPSEPDAEPPEGNPLMAIEPRLRERLRDPEFAAAAAADPDLLWLPPEWTEEAETQLREGKIADELVYGLAPLRRQIFTPKSPRNLSWYGSRLAKLGPLDSFGSESP